MDLPDHLYDVHDVIEYGAVRASEYLMRLRIEHLLKQPEGSLGLRRAMHSCVLAEVVNNAYAGSGSGPRADRVFGWFNSTLMRELVHRMVAAKATLRPDEEHFADLKWWGQLDKERASLHLETNLLRVVADEPTSCLMLSVEMQVLLDINMRLRYGSQYPPLIARYASKYPLLGAVSKRLRHLLAQPVAA